MTMQESVAIYAKFIDDLKSKCYDESGCVNGNACTFNYGNDTNVKSIEVWPVRSFSPSSDSYSVTYSLEISLYDYEDKQSLSLRADYMWNQGGKKHSGIKTFDELVKIMNNILHEFSALKRA